MNEKNVLSVSTLSKNIKQLIEGQGKFKGIWVRGEISNFTRSRNGRPHMYFSLKENQSVLRSAMFAGYNQHLPFDPKEGMKVLAYGDVEVYEPDGSYKLIVKKMEQDGLGNLYLQLEALKKKLEQEGLFSPDKKKPLPLYPQKIGVISSASGAATRDIITTLKRRYPVAQILFLPVAVQGEKSAPSLCEAIEKFNRHEEADVIIMGRGGGSIEDLWSFNDERVARAIFASKIPIISAVGHQTDFTIADFVADHRSPTPTAAAEEAVPHVRELYEMLLNQKRHMIKNLNAFMTDKQKKISFLSKRIELAHPERKIRENIQRLDQLNEKMQKSITVQLERKNNQLLQVASKLDGLSPLKIMKRGYTISYQNEKLIKSIKELRIKEEMEVRWHDGIAICTITNIQKDKERIS